MTDRDRDVRERCAEICDKKANLFEKLAREYVDLGKDSNARDCAIYVSNSRRLAGKIRALDLPLTSAREVTDGMVGAAFNVEIMLPAIFTGGGDRCLYAGRWYDNRARAEIARGQDELRVRLQAALASAPQSACVGVGEAALSRTVELFGDRYDGPRDGLCGGQLSDLQVAHQTAMLGRNDVAFEGVLATAKDRIRWLSRQLEIALPLSPAPSPQAGGEDELRQKIVAFDAFLNEPQLDIEPITLRDYRHQAFREWTTLRDQMLASLSARREG